ncbi:MAG TPA: EamA family transporter [Gaiellaceae bacterium]|nr:EamA family transporter [Gaiellaceae bacterium]
MTSGLTPYPGRPSRAALATALATLYVVWGSTYLAIAVLVDDAPPLTSAGTRFLLAGSLLALFLYIARHRRSVVLRRDEIFAAAGVSMLTLYAAFSLLFLGETRVPSGLAALTIASIPLWVVVLRLVGREPVDRLILLAVAVGFLGVAALLVPGAHAAVPVAWILVVLGAAISEATGSFLAQRVRLPDDPLLSATVQMLFAGALTLVTGLAIGERVAVDDISVEALVALAYLVVPGSVLAYTAFVWILQNTSASTATTYAYVNPVIALFLGWALVEEPVSALTLASAAIIVTSVAVVLRREAHVSHQAPPRVAARAGSPTPTGRTAAP